MCAHGLASAVDESCAVVTSDLQPAHLSDREVMTVGDVYAQPCSSVQAEHSHQGHPQQQGPQHHVHGIQLHAESCH